MESSIVRPVTYKHKIISYFEKHPFIESIEVTVSSTVFEQEDEEWKNIMHRMNHKYGFQKPMIGWIPSIIALPRLFDDEYTRKWKNMLRRHNKLA